MAPHRQAKEHDEGTATLVRDDDRTRPMGVVLRAAGALAKPPTYRLSTGTCVIGSAPTCDIVIAERTVSRTHLQLSLVPEGVAVQDLGSRNGTFYLGQRVERMTLGAGGILRIGGTATLSVEADTRALQDTVPAEELEYRGVVGRSVAMRRLFGMLKRLEGSLVTVLLEGESGVGKEVIARALHAGSKVSTGPFVAVNCGAIPRELVASELFGHRRGAFTGAVEARRGAFEVAHGGTLFLDEVGELPLEVQPMLLRALELGEIRAVGDDQPHQVKTRVIAATNCDLEADTRDGRFRADLFYRLAVVRLLVPPLRERLDDIEPLAQRFAALEGLAALPKEIIDLLLVRSYPGNARELRNVVQAFSALGVLPASGRATPDARRVVLQQSVDLNRPFAEQRDAVVEDLTRLYLNTLLAHTGGNQTAAARVAGLDRTYLGRLLAKLGMAKSE